MGRGSNRHASEEGSEVAWYKDVEAASSSSDRPTVDAGSASASSRIGSVGDVSTLVRAAHQRLAVPGPKQIWEEGFWGSIFQPASDPFHDIFGERFERPAQPSNALLDPGPESSKQERTRRPLVGSSFLQAVKNRDPVSWKAKREKEMEEALELWESFMLSWPNHLAVVSQLTSLSSSARPRMVRDLLRHKAPSTLLKRYRGLRGYFDHLSSFRVSFPGSESDCYNYLCHLQDKGKAASARKGVIEALAFARFVIGLVEVGNVNESRRCHGNAKVVSNRDREQASALKVAELQRLHHALEHDPSLWNKVFSGCSLMCTYGRSRWEDLMRTERIIWDFDAAGNLAIIECAVDVHKTRNAKQFKGTLLPFVAPALGVSEVNWGALWLQARKDLGLKDPQDGGPMMPAPDSDMQVTDRSLESDEAGAWLRYILYGGIDKLQGRRVSSHSLKCTCISFATKFGASPNEILLLGYHCGGYQMAITYGRDAASPSVLLLEKVLKAVRDGRFRPDETRSGRFVSMPRPTPIIEVKDEEFSLVSAGSLVEEPRSPPEPHHHTDDDQPVTTSSSSESSTSSSSRGAGKRSVSVKALLPSAPEGMCYWEHSKSRVLHLTYINYNKVFICGRVIGPRHSKVQNQPSAACSRCATCAKIADEEC